MPRLCLQDGFGRSDLGMAGHPIVPKIMTPQTGQPSFCGELAPHRAPALRGACRIITTNANGAAAFSLNFPLYECGDKVVVRLTRSELLRPDEQLLRRV